MSSRKAKVPDLANLPVLEMQILYGPDEDGIIILNKPAGMDTFNTHYHYSGYPQMADVLRVHFPNGGPPHRIDRLTSGIHVWGAERSTLSMLKKGWANNATKTYLCVAPKVPTWNYVTVDMDIRGDNNKYKSCVTGLRRISPDSRLIEAQLLEGGRYHQIRQCMKGVGHPIDGDWLYGGDEDAASRFLLHAWRWQFTIQRGDSIRSIDVKAQLPPDMAEWNGDLTEYTGHGASHTKPLWSFEVPPLTQVQYDKLAKFRAERVAAGLGGSLIWPACDEIKLGHKDRRKSSQAADAS